MNPETEKLATDAVPVDPVSGDDYKPFPVDVLPEPLRGFVSQGAKAIGVDPSFIALPALAVCGAAIGTTRRIRLKSGWEEPPIVWAVIVGDSGTKKTPAFCLALKPLREIQSKAYENCKAERLAFITKKAVFQAAKKKWETKPNGNPPKEPKEPEPDRCIVNDPTIEGLIPILQSNPRGVLMARDEISGWFGSHDRYASGGKGGADVAHYLSTFNAESLTVDRKTGTQRTIHIPCAAVSLTGGIQPNTLKRALGRDNVENGLASRLLMAMPRRRTAMWTTDIVRLDVESEYASVVKGLRGLAHAVTGDGDAPPVVLTFTTDAQQTWITFYNEHAEELAANTGAMAACLSKLEGYAARLALIFHLVRVAAGDTTLHDVNRVDEVSLRAAITLVRWFGNEARRIYGMLDESAEDSKRRKLIDLIRSNGGSITGRELVQKRRSVKTVAEAESMLTGLVVAGVGRWEQPSQGNGRQPSKRFVLGPPVKGTPPRPVRY